MFVPPDQTLWGAKVNLQGLVELLPFYSQVGRPKVADGTLRKGGPDHRRAAQVDAPQQQPRDGAGAPRSEADGADRPDASTGNRTLATSPKIKTSPNRNPFVGASLS